MARTSRWDRPPAPRDLRWAIRLVGKVLIATGLLMFGFVAYQLWGTGIEYARAQDRLGEEFEDLLATSPTSTTAAPGTTAVPTTTAATTTIPDTTAPATTEVDPEPSTTVAPTTTAAPTTTIAPTTTTSAPLLDFSYADDAPLAQLWIPSVGIEAVTVVQGVEREDLKEGPGHYPNTAFPGELGNAAIAGHRTTYGGPFRDLPDVEVGDEISLVTLNGEFIYRVTDMIVVNPDEGWVIQTTDPTVATLTLTTCTPLHTARQRFVVFAELVPERSAPVGRYVPRGADGSAVLPGGDYATTSTTIPTTTTATASTTPESAPASVPSPTTAPESAPETVPATATPTTTAPTTTAPPATTRPPNDPYSVVVGGVDDSGGGTESSDTSADEEAFGNHWFDDSAAWPHVISWGVVAAAVAVGAYLLARRFRNSWIGLAAGVVPFVVTLYFFYQNVNRLLPAAL
jgi:sortase A